jgi:hypothetical protein
VEKRQQALYYLCRSFEIDSLDPQTVYGLAFAYMELGDIKIGIRHPQTNGKLEDFWEYKLHRHASPSFEEFIEWYNNRPHGSLEFERFETLERAFRRTMPQEVNYRIGRKSFGL